MKPCYTGVVVRRVNASGPSRGSHRLLTAVLTLVCLFGGGSPSAQEKSRPSREKAQPTQEKPKPTDVKPKVTSLADIARLELERRKAVKVPSKVFTDKDVREALRKAPASEQAAGAATAPPDSAEPQKPADAAAEQPAPEKDEAWWRERVTRVREEIRRNEMFAEALQSRINALATEFANRDDPFQRLRIDADRQKAIEELQRVQEDIGDARTKLAEIEEEARRAGVPPGWLR